MILFESKRVALIRIYSRLYYLRVMRIKRTGCNSARSYANHNHVPGNSRKVALNRVLSHE